jgi:ankyrin repeat protein
MSWLATGLAILFAAGAIVWICRERQRRHEAARLVKAIADRDEAELLLLLVERADVDAVAEWFGEPALIIAVRAFAGEAVRLLISHGADVDEPGTERKTALMHAAADGNWELCDLLLSYGADATAGDMFGRTAADWAEQNGHGRTASLLRKVS